MGSQWGYTVTGTREPALTAAANGVPQVNNLSGLIKRKRPVLESNDQQQPAKVNVLGAGLVKRKPKA